MAGTTFDVGTRGLAAIVDAADEAIVVEDLNGIILTWNHAAERIFGYDACEAIGQPRVLIIPPDHRSEEDDIVARTRRGEHVSRYETLRLRKDGGLAQVSVTIVPIRDEQQRIGGVATVARDASDRRRIEVALAAAHASQVDLEQRLVSLVAASGTLFGSRKLTDTMPALIALARTLLPADGYAVWRYDSRTSSWHVGAASRGVGAFQPARDRHVPGQPRRPGDVHRTTGRRAGRQGADPPGAPSTNTVRKASGRCWPCR